MGNPTYAIQFDGSIVDGADIDAVKQQLSQLLRVERDALDRLFSGRPVTLKRGLDRQQAIVYQQALQRAGARVRAVPLAAAPVPGGARPAGRSQGRCEAPCPRCAYIQVLAQRCTRCRMDLRRRLPLRAR